MAEDFSNPTIIDKTVNFAGFNPQEVGQFLSIGEGQASTVIKAATAQQLNEAEFKTFQSIDKQYVVPGGNIPKGLEVLAAHSKGSHYSGDFNIAFQNFNLSKFFDRLFTIRPQSFTPSNIVRAGSAGTLTVFTAGLVKDVSIKENSVYNISQHDSSIVGSGYTGANSFGQVKSGNPNAEESVFERIARLTGGAISTIATGKALTNALSTKVAPLGEGSQGPVQQLSSVEKFGNTLSGGVSLASQGYSGGQFSQVVVSILGNKIGGALLSLLSGDIQGAIRNFNGPSTPQGPSQATPYGGGGGGGGGGAFAPQYSQNTGSSFVPLLIIGFIAVLAFLWWKGRR